ncbi:MAG: VWA domain-containing protein [Actinomycetota bacterium]|nr:VWA domain-containing protein [Actinomycetota bacterium]
MTRGAGRPHFPFSAVVGQEDAKLALLLVTVDPSIGGVLLRGQKGSAKTTLARGLAALLPGEAPFVELPLGATEDRVVGSLDLAAALTGEGVRFQPGLLAAAHGGVLYVDEVNLLADHLVDVLLDVAVSGFNRVEREGIAHSHPARFVLVGSMNPEEGELRPQLLDRFGLAVDVVTSTDPAERAEAVRRRLAFDSDPEAWRCDWRARDVLESQRLAAARSAVVPDSLLDTITTLCSAVGAEGLRADIVICRAAAALAGLEGRAEATVDDVRRVAPMALAHRRRRQPFEDPGLSQEELDEALEQAQTEADGEAGQAPERPPAKPAEPTAVRRLEAPRSSGRAEGRRSTVEGPRGRLVGDRTPNGPLSSVAVPATVRAAAARGAPVAVERTDLREAVREERAGNLVVLVVDASGSMGAERRMQAAKGAVLSLLLDAYQRRDRVALVTFRGDQADVALRPTGSVEVARARLGQLPTGGRTPLAAGILTALEVAQAGGSDRHRPLLVLVTDGRATSAPDGLDPVAAAHHAAARVRQRRVPAVVVDAEDGPTRLGLASELAGIMGARHLTLAELEAGVLAHEITAAADGGWTQTTS